MTAISVLQHTTLPISAINVNATMPIKTRKVPVRASLARRALGVSILATIILPKKVPKALRLRGSLAIRDTVTCTISGHLPVNTVYTTPSVLNHNNCLRRIRTAYCPNFRSRLAKSVLSRGGIVASSLFAATTNTNITVRFTLRLMTQLISPRGTGRVERTVRYLWQVFTQWGLGCTGGAKQSIST